MQALILAAGRGSRLGSVTDDRPKCLVDIMGLPIIDHQIRMLHECGIEDVVVVTGYQREQLKGVFERYPSITEVQNPFWPITNVIASVWFGLRHVNSSFVYLHGDTIFAPPVLTDLLAAKGDLVLPIDGHACADEEMKVRLEDGKVVEINKTMNPQTCDGEFLGVLKAERAVLPALRKCVDAELEEQRFTSFFEAVIQRGIDVDEISATALDVTGYFWEEIDTLDDLQRARQGMAESVKR